MRVRSWLALAAIVACAHISPDPRNLSAEQIARKGLGGWAVVTTYSTEVQGELISVDDDALVVRLPDTHELRHVVRADIQTAELFAYPLDGGLEAWRVGGSLSALSHGVWFVISLPIWLIGSAITVNDEADKAIVEYPEQRWESLAKWSRFPQGLPAGLDDYALSNETPEIRSRVRALQLSEAAVRAARANDCGIVKSLDAQVLRLAPEVHVRFFSTCPEVVRCLREAAPVDAGVPDAPPDAP